MPKTIFFHNQEEILASSLLISPEKRSEIPFFSAEDYIITDHLGDNSTKAFNRKLQKYVLLKSFDFSLSNPQLLLEASLYEKISDFPIKFQGISKKITKNGSEIYILQIECGAVSLEELLKSGKSFSEQEILLFLSKIAKTLAFLQENGIANREITLKNLHFFEKAHEFRLIDYSHSSVLPKSQNTMEIESSKAYNPFKGDVFSLGMVILKMIDYFFEQKTLEYGILHDQLFRKYPQIKVLLGQMLAQNSENRPDFVVLQSKINEIQVKMTNFEEIDRFIQICYNKKTKKKTRAFSGIKSLFQEHRELFLFFKGKNTESARFHLEKAWLLNQEIIFQRKNRKKCGFDNFKLEIQEKSCENSQEEEELFLLNELGEIYLELENFMRGEEILQKAVKIIENYEGNPNKIELFANIYKNIGSLYSLLGFFEKAEGFYQKMISFDENPEKMAGFYDVFGGFYRQKGDLSKAKKYYKEAFLIRKRLFGEKSKEISDSLENLGVFYTSIGKIQKSKQFLIKCLKKRLNFFGETHSKTADIFENLAKLNEKTNNLKEAQELLEKSLAIRENLSDSNEIFKSFLSFGHFFLRNFSENTEKILVFFKKYHLFLKSKKLACFRSLSYSYMNLGELYLVKKDMKSEKYFKKAFEKHNLLYNNFELSPFTALCYYKLAQVYENLVKNAQKAEEFYLLALKFDAKNPEIFRDFAIFHENHSNFFSAEEFYLRSHSLILSKYPKPTSESSDSSNFLGIFYESQKNPQKACEFYQDSLSQRLSLYGESHPDIISSYDNLGNLYESLKDLKTAEEYYKKSVKACKEVFGKSHYQTSECYNNLGVFYCRNDELFKAERCYYQALEIQSEVLGENDIRTIRTMSNLGILCDKNGDFDKAEEFFNKSLEKMTQNENSEDLGNCYSNLGKVYLNKREFEKARIAFLRCLEVFEGAFGKNHENIAKTYQNLGGIYENLEEWEKAEKCFLRAVEIIEGLYEEKNEKIAGFYNSLGLFYENMGDFNQAKDVLMRNLEFWGEGEEKAALMNKIGLICYKMGDLTVSEDFYLKCLCFLREESEETALCYNNLGLLYKSLGLLVKSEEYYLKAISISERIFGEDNGNTATSYNNLGGVYVKMDEFDKAEAFYLKSMKIREKIYGEHDIITASSYNNLGALYNKKGRSEEAKGFGFKAYEVYAKVYGEEDESTKIILANANSYI